MSKNDPQQISAREALCPASPAVLVVTASPAEAELFLEIGRPWGSKLTACRDYWQAGWELTLRRYDLALIDIDLDPVLGLEWLSRLHAIALDLTIIALTGDSSREREIAARNRGIAFYFVRPAEPRDLASIFQHVARKKTQARLETAQTFRGRATPRDPADRGGEVKEAGADRRTGADRRRKHSS